MIIQTSGLTKVYQSKIAVDHINLKVKAGSLTALLGPNGAGKTTIMSMLAGLLTPTVGTIRFKPGAKVSMVFQQSILDNDLTVKENLEIRSHFYKNVAPGRINDLIGKVGLTGFVNQKYQQLSGGQRRRVDIARALIDRPDVLFLDEPTTGLDVQTRSAIWTLLHELREHEHLTIILTTHYLDEADHADEVYIIDHGSIIADGSADSIKAEYAHRRLTILTTRVAELLRLIPKEVVQTVSDHRIVCLPSSTDETLRILASSRRYIESFNYQSGTMDDAFLKLTGREMR